MSEKKVLDYFIEHTNQKFTELKADLEAHRAESKAALSRLTKLVLFAGLLCICLSPAGAHLLEKLPSLLELAAAVAAGVP